MEALEDTWENLQKIIEVCILSQDKSIKIFTIRRRPLPTTSEDYSFHLDVVTDLE